MFEIFCKFFGDSENVWNKLSKNLDENAKQNENFENSRKYLFEQWKGKFQK